MGAPVDVCKGVCVCACVWMCVCKRRGSPPQSVNLMNGLVRARETLILVGTGWGSPLSPHSLLCLISDSVFWGGSEATLMLPIAASLCQGHRTLGCRWSPAGPLGGGQTG